MTLTSPISKDKQLNKLEQTPSSLKFIPEFILVYFILH